MAPFLGRKSKSPDKRGLIEIPERINEDNVELGGMVPHSVSVLQKSTHVRVLARFRPINHREKQVASQESTHESVEYLNGHHTVAISDGGGHRSQFTLDRIFPPDSSQEEVFGSVVSTVDDVLAGYNGTVFAYGQTGSGKTWSMFGTDIDNPSSPNRGLVPRAMTLLFNKVRRSAVDEITIKCAFFEVYNEQLKDLIEPESGHKLRVRENADKSVWVEGLSQHRVECEKDVFALIASGAKSRAVASTDMNDESSRSHAVLTITCVQKLSDGSVKRGKLNFADLAGSEKVKKTGASGSVLKEASAINKSLSALGQCIKALTDSAKRHIPYRDSKLTFLLQDSLGGNCKTTLLVTCSPHRFNLDETVSTLRFAQRAKRIKNEVRVNKQRSVKELTQLVNQLRRELTKSKDKHKKYKRLVKSAQKELAGFKVDSEILSDLNGDHGASNNSRRLSVIPGSGMDFQMTEEELQLADQLQSARTELADARRDRDALHSEIAALQLELIQVRHQAHHDTVALEQSREVSEEARFDLGHHKEMYASMRSELESKVAALGAQNRQLTKSLEISQSQADSGFNVSKEVAQLRIQVAENDKELESKRQEWQQSKSALHNQVSSLESSLKERDSAMANLTSQRDSARQSQHEHARASLDAQQRLRELMAAHDELRSRHEQLHSQKVDLMTRLLHSEKRADDAHAELESQSESIASLRAKLDKAEQRNRELESAQVPAPQGLTQEEEDERMARALQESFEREAREEMERQKAELASLELIHQMSLNGEIDNPNQPPNHSHNHNHSKHDRAHDHPRQEAEPAQFRCSVCGETFNELIMARSHVDTFHPNMISCGKCGRDFQDQEALECHHCQPEGADEVDDDGFLPSVQCNDYTNQLLAQQKALENRFSFPSQQPSQSQPQSQHDRQHSRSRAGSLSSSQSMNLRNLPDLNVDLSDPNHNRNNLSPTSIVSPSSSSSSSSHQRHHSNHAKPADPADQELESLRLARQLSLGEAGQAPNTNPMAEDLMENSGGGLQSMDDVPPIQVPNARKYRCKFCRKKYKPSERKCQLLSCGHGVCSVCLASAARKRVSAMEVVACPKCAVIVNHFEIAHACGVEVASQYQQICLYWARFDH